MRDRQSSIQPHPFAIECQIAVSPNAHGWRTAPLNKQGDNLANYVQYLEKEHKSSFNKALAEVAKKIPGVKSITHKRAEDGRLLLQFNDTGYKTQFTILNQRNTEAFGGSSQMSCGQTTAIQPAERHIPLQPHAEPTAHWEYQPLHRHCWSGRGKLIEED